MSGLHKAKKTKKNRKHGRNAAFCLAYKNSNRREKNKVKKLTRHLVAFANDRCAVHCLANLKKDLGNR
jgi:hypothetical protein